MNTDTERPSAPTGASTSEKQEPADRPLGDAACCASSFRLFAADFIFRVIEKYPGSHYTTWTSTVEDETMYSVAVFPDGRDKEGCTFSSPCLCILIDSICKRYPTIPQSLYSEFAHDAIPQLRVRSWVVTREFDGLSPLVSGWLHQNGIPIRNQETTSNQRPSAPTGASTSETNLQADRPLGGAACCASSFLEGVAPILNALFRRNGVGSVELRDGKLRFSFGHCIIGIVVSGDTPRLSSWVEKSGLLTENPIIRNFDVGDAVKAYRESLSSGEVVEKDVCVTVNHPSPETLDLGVNEGGVY